MRVGISFEEIFDKHCKHHTLTEIGLSDTQTDTQTEEQDCVKKTKTRVPLNDALKEKIRLNSLILNIFLTASHLIEISKISIPDLQKQCTEILLSLLLGNTVF